MKTCPKCKEIKTVNDFHSDKSTKDNLSSWCKSCRNKNTKRWSADNLIKAKEYSIAWRKINRKKWCEYSKIWQKKNPEKVRKMREARPNYSRDYMRLWRMANPEKNKENTKRADIKRRNTPKGILNKRMASLVYWSLRGNKHDRWESLVGYTVNQLKIHLEEQFKEGMSWENKGEWHIDHIIPISVFNFEKSDDDDFKRCWDLKNLQPLWAEENMRKHSKLKCHFQPNLIFK